MQKIQILFPEIGRIRPRSVREIAGSKFTLGCETLDRGYADYEEYKEYIPPLGIKTIRLQAGWGKTEKVRGVYDFRWLDKIIFDAAGRGLNILLETDYGNSIYPGGGGDDHHTGFPVDPEPLAAWDRWIEAMARHYAGTVRDWAMWNEPDIPGTRSVEQTVDFNIRTAKLIRKIIPDARIGGLSLADSTDAFDEYLSLMEKKGELGLFEWIIYHGYLYNPDEAYGRGARLQRFLARHTPVVKLRQGENGCPSERVEKFFSFHDYDWTEFSQAKWDLRRFIGDVAHDVETSVFTICDFDHIGRTINRKGLLRAEKDHKVVGIKQVYYAIQHMTSVFDDTLQPAPRDRAAVLFKRNCAAFPFANTAGKGNLCVYWDRSDIPGESTATEPGQLLLLDLAFDEPVLADVISGSVYAIPADRIVRQGDFVQFRDMPVTDSPLLIAEKRLLHLQ